MWRTLLIGTGLLLVAVFVATTPASSAGDPRIVIVLENKGPSPFTQIGLGFDLPPLDPGQTLDVTVENPPDHGNPRWLDQFRSGGKAISRNNPLPAGGIACTKALKDLVSGTTLEHDQVESFPGGFSGVVNAGFPEIIADVTILPFDFAHSGVTGGRLTGEFRFLSADKDAKDACKKQTDSSKRL